MEFGIRGTSNVLISRLSDEDPIIFLPNVSFSGIHVEGEFVSSRGGEGGMNLIAWNENVKADFRLTTPIFSMNFLSITTGSTLNVKEGLIHETEILECDEENKIKLKSIPSDKKPLFIFELDKSGRQIVNKISKENFEQDGDIIEILVSLAGDWVLVYYYHKTTIEQLQIGKPENLGYCSLVGDTIIYNRNTAESESLKFEFPKIEIKNQFDLNILNADNPNQYFVMDCSAVVKDSKDKVLLRMAKTVSS